MFEGLATDMEDTIREWLKMLHTEPQSQYISPQAYEGYLSLSWLSSAWPPPCKADILKRLPFLSWVRVVQLLFPPYRSRQGFQMLSEH